MQILYDFFLFDLSLTLQILNSLSNSCKQIFLISSNRCLLVSSIVICFLLFLRCPSPIIVAKKKAMSSFKLNGIFVILEGPNLALT